MVTWHECNWPKWQRIRRRFLAANPACEGCGKLATCVDHRDGDASNNNSSNHAAYCAICHSKKGYARDGLLGRPRPDKLTNPNED